MLSLTIPPFPLPTTVSAPRLGTLPHPMALSGIPTFSLGGPSENLPTASASLAASLPVLATSPVSLAALSPTTLINFSHLPSGGLPQKLIKKILDLEFVDMSELLPDTWRLQEEEESKCCHQPRRTPRRGPVTDILKWVECYAAFVAVLTSRYPDKSPELMAYMRTIVHAQRTFAGEGWVTYDICYRRQAATLKTLNWSQIDFNKYNEIFTGRAKPLARCRYCSSESHRSDECRYAPEQPPPRQPSPWRNDPQGLQICRLFNNPKGNLCRYKPCRYSHLCGDPACRGQHPQSTCGRNRNGLARRPRSRSPPRRLRTGLLRGRSPYDQGA